MKVLHVIPTLDPRSGGPAEGLRLLGSELQKLSGFSVEVATLDSPQAPWLTNFPIETHAIGPAYGNYRYCPRLVRWLREHAANYDAVSIHGLWQHTGFGTWMALRKTGMPYVIFPHGMLDPWFKRQYPLKHYKKWLYWPWADYQVLRDARAVCFTCDEERLLARKSFWLYCCREEVVGYGVRRPAGDPEGQKRAFAERCPELRGHRILLYLGRLHEKKAPDLLIEGFRQIITGGLRPTDDGRPLALVMAGPASSPEYRHRLETLAGDLLHQPGTPGGLGPMITFPGMLEGELKWGACHSADALILPSHQENFGIAVVEALACGTPVLISNKVNIWREIARGGGLVEDDTVDGVVRLLTRWLTLSLDARTEMRKTATRCFETHFEIGHAARRLAGILDPDRAKEGFGHATSQIA